MGRRIALLLTCLSVALTVALQPNALRAEPAPPTGTYDYPGGLQPPASMFPTTGKLDVMLELADPAPASAPERARLVASQQQVLIDRLGSVQAQLLFQAQLSLNAVAVRLPANQLVQAGQLPGVRRALVIPPKQPLGSSSADLQPSGALASAITGATGAGVRVALIDRGIDYTHADFGGSGRPADYAANNPAVREPGTFPTAKVFEGFDFAGDGYDASGALGSASPSPDDDPLECNRVPAGATPPPYMGQGTHVAGLLAGFGVTSSGATYTGPYPAPADAPPMNVSPGLAPEARLLALKVFGCRGSTTLLTAAIERALDPNRDGSMADHVDVLVITLGTPFGSPDDPDALAVDAAVRAGVVVVVAAGDRLNTFYSVNSPASARLAIAVGATTNGDQISAGSARGPARGNQLLKPDMVAPGQSIPSAGVGSGVAAVAMSGTAAAAAQVGGAAALLRELHADWVPVLIKAALINSATPSATPPTLAGGGRLNASNLSAASLLAFGDAYGGVLFRAPWVASAQTPTRTLTLANTSATAKVVTLAATTVTTETGVQLQLPSGPITVPARSQVQVTVGAAIDPHALDFSPDAATVPEQNGRPRHYLAEHSGYIRVLGQRGSSDTRVRPAHAAHFPSVDFYLDETLLDDSLDSREVQDYTNTTPGQHIVKLRRVGAAPNAQPLFTAPVNLPAGRDYTLIIVGQPGALGVVVVDETAASAPPAGQALIHYVNANRAEPGWGLSAIDVYLDGVLRVSGLGLGASSPYTPIAPGQHTVQFFQAGVTPTTGQPLAEKQFVAVAGQALLAGTGRHDDDDGDLGDFEQRAFIGADQIRLGEVLLASVPYSVLPTAASAARAAGEVVVPPGARTFSVALRNSGARNSGLVGGPVGLPSQRTPLASAFELAATSPAIAGLATYMRPADLQYVGVTSSYSVTQNLDLFTYIYFGMSSFTPWSTPSEVMYQVWIDSNRDGVDDFVLLNSNLGELTVGAASDVFVSALFPLTAGKPGATYQFTFWGTYAAPSQSSVNLAPFNSSVMFQRAKASDLALPLDPGNPNGPKGPTPTSFCYHVETRARVLGGFAPLVDRAPQLGAPVAACGNRAGVLLYDILNPAIAPINTSNFIFSAPIAPRPVFVDVEGGVISGLARPDVLANRSGAKLLILHHHNAPYPQAELVNVRLAAAKP